MKIDIGEIEIIAENRPRQAPAVPVDATPALTTEEIRREIRQICEALIREEFRRRAER